MVCPLSKGLNNESASSFGAFLLLGFLMPMVGSAWGAESAPLKTEIGISLMRFDYQEVDDGGRVLDKEQGGIPGLSMKVAQRLSAWEWESAASYHRGQVQYTGQTNFGNPYSTQTDEKIGDLSLRLGRWFDGRFPVMPYAGIGYRRWDRNILPASLNGLFESYRWEYIWLGSKFVALQRESSQIVLDIGALKPLNPEVRIDFRGTYSETPTVYPESKIGLRMMLTSSMALSKSTRITIEPYYEYWKLGRSPTVTTGTLTVYEPTSTTGNMGINVRFGWML